MAMNQNAYIAPEITGGEEGNTITRTIIEMARALGLAEKIPTLRALAMVWQESESGE